MSDEADLTTVPSMQRIILRGALGQIENILKRGQPTPEEVNKVIGIAQRALRETREV